MCCSKKKSKKNCLLFYAIRYLNKHDDHVLIILFLSMQASSNTFDDASQVTFDFVQRRPSIEDQFFSKILQAASRRNSISDGSILEHRFCEPGKRFHILGINHECKSFETIVELWHYIRTSLREKAQAVGAAAKETHSAFHTSSHKYVIIANFTWHKI